MYIYIYIYILGRWASIHQHLEEVYDRGWLITSVYTQSAYSTCCMPGTWCFIYMNISKLVILTTAIGGRDDCHARFIEGETEPKGGNLPKATKLVSVSTGS